MVKNKDNRTVIKPDSDENIFQETVSNEPGK